MKKSMKRGLAAIMAAMLLACTAAPAAFAVETEGTTVVAETQVAVTNSTTVTTEEQLRAAVAENATYDLITLDNDITLTGTTPLQIARAVTINGNDKTLTGPSGSVNAINIAEADVTLQNLNIVTGRYGVVSSGHNLTVKNCTIQAPTGGISFQPANGSGATLTVTGTTITNSAVSNYNTTACYSTDNRGINTYNVTGGTINIENCSILGFKYSLNPVVDAVSGLRDGQNTTFEVTNTTIKGWTALNMWSANTNYTFTDCNLIGINTLSGTSNGFSTIVANHGIYGSAKDKSSTVTFKGGYVTAVKYGSAHQSVFSVDNALQTKYVFQPYEKNGVIRPVEITGYSVDNLEDADGSTYTAHVWNYYWFTSEEESLAYENAQVGYPSNCLFAAGAISDYEATFTQS